MPCRLTDEWGQTARMRRFQPNVNVLDYPEGDVCQIGKSDADGAGLVSTMTRQDGVSKGALEMHE